MEPASSRDLVPSNPHSQVVAAYGAPRWFEFYEDRRVGRLAGGVLSSVGIAGIGFSFLARLEKRGAVFAASAVLSGLGLWLASKKYFRDPAALREYQENFTRLPLVKSIAEFGWNNIFTGACRRPAPRLLTPLVQS